MMDLDSPQEIQTYFLYERDRKFLKGELEDEIQEKLAEEYEEKDSLSRESKKHGKAREKRKRLNKTRRKIIDDRLPGLPMRIQNLVDDISLLRSGGVLNSEVWPEGWDQLSELQPRLEFESQGDNDQSPIWLPNTKLENDVQVGFVFGRMIRYITSGFESAVDLNELVWGFLLGLFGEPRHRVVKELHAIDSATTFAKRKTQEKADELPHDEYLAELLEESIPNEALDGESLVHTYDSLVNSDIPTQHSFENQEDSTIDLRIPLPLTSEIEGFQSRSLFEGIIQKSPEDAENYLKLAQNLRIDLYLISSSKYNSVIYLDAFRVAWDTGETVNRRTIVEEENSDMRTVSKIMDDLGEDSTSHKWKNRPPIVEDESERRSAGRKWSTTAYGELIGQCLFTEDGDEQVFHQIGQMLTTESTETDVDVQIMNAKDELVNWLIPSGN